MITNWKILDPIRNNTTTFRFLTDNEKIDLNFAEHLVNKYVSEFGYETDGLIKIKMEDDVFFEIITTLPFSVFKKNNDFFDFVAVSDKEIKGIKNK